MVAERPFDKQRNPRFDKLDFNTPNSPISGINFQRNPDGSYTLTRLEDEKPWHEDQGFRLFIVPSDYCDEAAKEFRQDPVAYYGWLKKNDSGGRMLALGPNPVIKSDKYSSLIILKRVDHRTRNRVTTPDIYRGQVFADEPIREVITDRLLHWDGDRPLKLSLLTQDVPTVFCENPKLSSTNSGNNELPIIPGENLIIMDELHKHEGQMGPRINNIKVRVETSETGQKEWVVTRPENDLYLRLKQSTDEEWKKKVVASLGLKDVEDLQNIASGISGIIDINGTLHCYNGQNEIRVPVDGKVCFVAEATRGQRRVMELEVYKTAEGEQMVRWIAGIEPLQEYVVYDSRGTIKSTIHLTPIEGKIVLKAEAEKQKAREEAKEEENNRRLGQSRIVKNPLGAQRFFG